MSENPHPGEAQDRPRSAALRDRRGSPVVSGRMLRALGAIAETLFATAAGPLPGDRLAWLLAECEDFLGRAGARSRRLVGLAVLAVSVLAPLLLMRIPPLRRLPHRERVRALIALEASAVAGPLFAVKALLSMLY
jgi:hypothetical protein